MPINLQQPFAGMAQDDTAMLILHLLSSILEKLPRTDNFDRLIVNGSEIAQAVSGTVAVSTASDLTRVNAFGSSAATARPADAVTIHLSNIGAAHLYNLIEVTP